MSRLVRHELWLWMNDRWSYCELGAEARALCNLAISASPTWSDARNLIRLWIEDADDQER